MDDFDQIPEGVEPNTLEYWRARSRQWEKRCKRAEREKTDLIAELNALKASTKYLAENRRALAIAVGEGDVQPVGRDYTPRLPKGWR